MKKAGILFLMVMLVCSLSLYSQRVNWKDQVIYFVMTDRFANGDPSNDVLTDSGIEFGHDGSKYTGGDLQGLIDQLDYIQGLGATAIWLTPPVANQWWDEHVNYGGYHGYWTRDMKKIEEHFGDLALYKQLIDELHRRGMYLIQDIVCNHMGNYYVYDKQTGEYRVNTGSFPPQDENPLQYPFNLIDYNDPDQRAMNIYHWESEQNPPTLENTSFADLDDLNTENERVISTLKDSFRYWIEQGVDGYRIDTVIYVQDPFWMRFLSDRDGIVPFANESGKSDFLIYGEAWTTPAPYENDAEELVSRYFDLGFNSMLDFPLLSEIHRVFKEGKPTDFMKYRLEQREAFFDGKTMITFIDNHDMVRFLKGSQVLDLMQALGFIFTIPGIPCIYYGTEQAFDETRASMFADGFYTKDDQYDTQSALYTYIRTLTQLRAEYEAFRYGKVSVLYTDKIGPGPFIYQITYRDENYFVMMNTHYSGRYVCDLQTGLPEGTILEPVFTSRMIAKEIQVGQDGILNKLLDPKAFGIFKVTGTIQAVKDSGIRVDFNEMNRHFTENFSISGTSENAKKIRLYFDGSQAEYATVEPSQDGTWEIPVRLVDFVSGTHKVFVKAYGKLPIHYAYSHTLEIELDIPIITLAKVSDPVGDDHGLTGDYLPPKGEGYFQHEMDLTHVSISQVGQILKMEIQTKDISDRWTPSNGFDHSVFQIFFDNPDMKGALYLPQQQAKMPVYEDGTQGDWDYEVYATGWTLATYSSEGADDENYGKPIQPTPVIKTDKEAKTITLLIPLESLNTKSVEGWTIYITTFDYDGIESLLRRVSPNPKKWDFRAPSEDSPKIMDDILIAL